MNQFKEGDEYYLITDPCIHTKDRDQGLNDLGQDGIDNFFA